MAGTPLFKRGQHPSRYALGHAEISEADARELRQSLDALTVRGMDGADFRFLLCAILEAKACERPDYDPVTRKDTVAQLQAMGKLRSDDELLAALRKCDHRTLEAIRRAQNAAISDVLWCEGLFVDVEGQEHRTPPGLEFVGPRDDVGPYLPMGFDGLRRSIAVAITTEEEIRDRAGRREKNHQADLARECVQLWQKYGPPDRQKIWREAPIVVFAEAVFRAAGMCIASSRLCVLLEKAS